MFVFIYRGYDIEMNALHWYGSWPTVKNLRLILLNCVYVFLLLFKVLCFYSSLKNIMYTYEIQINSHL